MIVLETIYKLDSNHRENVKKEAMYFTAKRHTENRRQTLKIKIEKRKD